LRRWRQRASALAAIGVAAVVLRLLYGAGGVGFDTSFQLVWGDDLLHGRVPDFESRLSPTPHPLAYVALAPAALLGDAAYDVVEALAWFSLGLLGYAAFRLGEALFAPVVGAGFAVVLVTRPVLVDETMQAFVDIPCLALVLLAAAHEARRPRHWPVVLGLLALAGLLRPESWLLAGAYWLYAVRGTEGRERLALTALAAAGPVVWALTDLVATGDPLFSLHFTQDAAEARGRPRGLGNAVELTPTLLGEMLRDPIVWGGFAGTLLTLHLLYERALLPGAILVLGLGGFLVLGVADLPLLRRYMFPAGAVLALFCVVALAGWTLLDRGDPWRRRWLLAALLPLVLVVVSVPGTVDDLRAAARNGEALGRSLDALRAEVGREPAREALRRCGGARVTDAQAAAVVAYLGDVRLGDIARDPGAASRGVALAPISATVGWGVWTRCPA
jgi:hypothetical protein